MLVEDELTIIQKLGREVRLECGVIVLIVTAARLLERTDQGRAVWDWNMLYEIREGIELFLNGMESWP